MASSNMLLSCTSSLSQALSLLLFFLLPAFNTAATIPPPNATYGIGLSTAKLTDESRIDPYSLNHEYRSVMLSAFYPVGLLSNCVPQTTAYMPPATARIQDTFYAPYGLPSGAFEALDLSLSTTPHHINSYPLILFSPGLGNSRLIYSALAQSIASHGYTVVTIDHPYDANVVEFPDGRLVLGANITTTAQILQALDVRVGDVRFLLDSLSHLATARKLMPGLRTPLNTSHVLVAGHSLGGATAAQAMLGDRRLIAGVDLDGTVFGDVVLKGLEKPFVLFGHEGKNLSTDASWEDIWAHSGGWKRELELEHSQHATFSDLPVLVDVMGLRDVLPGVDTVLGSIGGERARLVVSTVLARFGKLAREGGSNSLLDGKAKEWPEVVLVAK